MIKLNYKSVSVILSLTITMSFLGAIFSVTQAQSPSYKFIRDLTTGSTGEDVRALQQFLNSHEAQVSKEGPGSPGNETTYFGKATKAALARWQKANGISPAFGYFSLKSRSAVTVIVNKPVEAIPSVSVISGFPMRLKIPKINIDAVIEHVGLTPGGAMDVPKNSGAVAWFNLGPRPGENGTSVIDGHYGKLKNGKGSVFDNLYKLVKGDKLHIEDEKGAIITFVVREILKYDPKADASGVFGSNQGESHLNLITCEGIWDKISKSYSQRLVVFTDKE